ncbi:MAG: hypothetical protein P1U86_10785 [Verrucomicrobiales bacterium]|nr:hypothetical protein [Verrucomicrobiales bacterium]
MESRITVGSIVIFALNHHPHITRSIRDLLALWLTCCCFATFGVSCAQEHPEPQATLWNCGDSSPVIAAHYMPWFSNPETNPTPGVGWKHWNWAGPAVRHDPTSRREDGLRDLAATKYPLIGPYSSNNEAVIRYHFETARAAGIEAMIVIWYGPGSETDAVIPKLLEVAEATGLKISLCYEEKINWAPFRAPASRKDLVDSAQRDLAYLLEKYSTDPAYLTRAGKPVVFQFNYWGEDEMGRRNILPHEWQRIFDGLARPLSYVRQNQDDAFHPPIGGRYLWFTKDENHIESFGVKARAQIDEGQLEYFVGMASPEFDDSGVNGWGNGTRATPGAGLSLFKDTFERAWRNGPEMIQLVTWNDFNEGTVIEPTLENGFQYLDALEVWLGEKTGREVDLEDNRAPFQRYIENASEAERNEVPHPADEVVDRESKLDVVIPNYLETLE